MGIIPAAQLSPKQQGQAADDEDNCHSRTERVAAVAQETIRMKKKY